MLHLPSLWYREGSNQDVDYDVPLHLFSDMQCFSFKWRRKADLVVLGREWERERVVLADGGLFFWEAGKVPV